MKFILPWYRIASKLKPAFSNNRAFNLSILLLLGISTRKDELGRVTSLARALPLSQTKRFYQRSLDLFRSNLSISKLQRTWCDLVFEEAKESLVTVNERSVCAIDGIVIPKEGKNIASVQSLHQSSENNSKAPFVVGHYFHPALGHKCWSSW